MIGPSNTVDLGGAGLTVHTLELIAKVANEHGEVLIKNVGSTSLMQVAVDLLDYAKATEVKSGT